MASLQSLRLLLDHAKKQVDNAAINLGKLNLKQQDVEETLLLLLEYRENYQTQLMESAGSGIDLVKWHNFMAFISKLDRAIKEQQKLVAQTQQHATEGSAEFRAHQKRLKSYGTLLQRAQLCHQSHLLKQEQRQLDEHTAHNISRRLGKN